MIQFLRKRWVYHSLVWIGFYSTLLLFDFIIGTRTYSFLEFLREPFFIFAPIVIVAYLGLFAKKQFFDQRRYLVYFIAFIAIVLVGAGIYESLNRIYPHSSNTLAQNIFNFVAVQLIAVGVQYFKRGIINQYQLQELKAKKAITELQALKAQINPHFLFNTLNNIYGINQINPEQGSEMIMELSDVMRYHLEFSKQGKVRLEDEIELLQSYIKLEQLRLRENCDVQLDFEGANRNLLISPLLFIPFIENAFKHGTHPTQNCFVHIQLTTTPNQLFFTVKNSLITNRKVVKTHIGLQNTKRRLELLFPQKHQLKIIKKEGYHLVNLEIEL
ncbi:MAG: histidine kinase [Bacteroidota bacterium]